MSRSESGLPRLPSADLHVHGSDARGRSRDDRRRTRAPARSAPCGPARVFP